MSARNRLTISNLVDTARCNRMATPLSSHKTGARLRANGGDGDGGNVILKASSTAACRIPASGRQEKSNIASTLRAASIRNKASGEKVVSPRKGKASVNGDKKFPDRLATIGASKQSDRMWPTRKSAVGAAIVIKDKLEEVQNNGRIDDEPATIIMLDTGIQTDEAEIMNRDLLVGDIKLLMPSTLITRKIDKTRRESPNKSKRESKRKFDSHERDEEQHLDELKEYMERTCVTKRAAKKPSSILPHFESAQYCNVFKSMDEFFTREIPKTESISNIQDRIKRKEEELMSLFDGVDVQKPSESESEAE
ncbi:uncharacterized protein LOC117567847 [Drosophila albomicans]|uniref:Uncharacterized protein LOC117567847 n=1 Tax=Drosophila albomicans TaxID=7291 RepID=A0A6P8WZB0_DROAB|nr:uncharacterized protein LOC117567847 [Drosophila albomicans]